MREGEAHERSTYIYIYIYTFAHSGVRQVSNATINYPTVFCYRACAPPYLSPSSLLCPFAVYITFSGIRDSNPCLSISGFFFLRHRENRHFREGRDFFLFLLPFVSSKRRVSRSMRENFAWSLSIVGVMSRVGQQQQQ